MAAQRYPVAEVVPAALAQASGKTPEACRLAGLLLQDDLGVDSLALLELIESLQEQLNITVPDEDTGQVRTVGDLVAVIQRLTTPPDGE